MTILAMWTGGVLENRIRAAARLSGPGTARLALSTSADMSNPVLGPPAVADPTRGYWVQLEATGLTASTAYYYAIQVDGTLDTMVGQTRTAPPEDEPAPFTFGAASCNKWDGPVGTSIRNAGLDLFIHMGDLGYFDQLSNYVGSDLNDPLVHANFRLGELQRPLLGAAWRNIPVALMIDDHDGDGNTSWSGSVGRAASRAAYRLTVPSYDLPAPDGLGLYHHFRWGRVWVIMLDVRTYRDRNISAQPRKQNIGREQMQWLKKTLLAARDADAPLIVLSTGVTWHTDENVSFGESWGLYQEERKEIANFVARNGLGHRLMLIYGDTHAIACDDGTHGDYSDNGWGRVPSVGAAPIAQTHPGGFGTVQAAPTGLPSSQPGTAGGPYTSGKFWLSGSWSTIEVTDTGSVPVDVEVNLRNTADPVEITGLAAGEVRESVLYTMQVQRGALDDSPPAGTWQPVTVQAMYSDRLTASQARVWTGTDWRDADVYLAQ